MKPYFWGAVTYEESENFFAVKYVGRVDNVVWNMFLTFCIGFFMEQLSTFCVVV